MTYALRLHETGVIKNSPSKLIAQGVNWRFINELKREAERIGPAFTSPA